MGNNIKQDVNFLEYPLHVVDYQGSQQILEIKTDRGSFRLVSGADDRLPSSEDRVILYYFMKKMMASKYSDHVVETTRYQVCKDIWDSQGKRYYDMVVKSLKRYTKLSAEFNNVFYENKHYNTKIFHIIDSTVIEDGQLIVTFNKIFVDHMHKSHFYRMINYEEIKKLRSNTAIRLYEYMIKQPLPFVIGIVKLGEKLTFPNKERFPSTILRRVKPAVEEINKKTSLKISMAYDQDARICRFTAMRPESIIALEKKKDAPFDLADDTPDLSMLDALSPEKRAALEDQAKVVLNEAGLYLGTGERGRMMVCEEMLRIFLAEKETVRNTV